RQRPTQSSVQTHWPLAPLQKQPLGVQVLVSQNQHLNACDMAGRRAIVDRAVAVVINPVANVQRSGQRPAENARTLLVMAVPDDRSRGVAPASRRSASCADEIRFFNRPGDSFASYASADHDSAGTPTALQTGFRRRAKDQGATA